MALESSAIDEAAAEAAVARAQAAMKEDHVAEEVASSRRAPKSARAVARQAAATALIWGGHAPRPRCRGFRVARREFLRRRFPSLRSCARDCSWYANARALGIIAGSGVYPLLLADAARVAGVKKIIVAAFTDETSADIINRADEIEWLRVGQLGKLLSFFRETNMRQAIMAGQIAPGNLFSLRPDFKAMFLLARLKQRNAESIFGAIADQLAEIGSNFAPRPFSNISSRLMDTSPARNLRSAKKRISSSALRSRTAQRARRRPDHCGEKRDGPRGRSL